MKINTYFKTVIFSVTIATTITSCVKNDDWETPPIVCNNKFDAPTISLADFVKLAPATGTYKIPADGAPVIVDAYVVSSDEFGNFYKTISIQDKAENPTVGISIEVDKGSNYVDFPVGSHVRIKANGLVLGMDRGTMKIGSVDPQYAIGRIPSVLFPRYIAGVCNGNGMEIVKLVPTKLNNLGEAKNPKYLNTLVTVPNVQFADTDVTFVNYLAGVAQITNRDIVDKTGGRAILRNSDFVTFGGQMLPSKNGDITFVVSAYSSTGNLSDSSYQMYIRGLDDINFNNPRLATGILGGTDITYSGSFTENFESYAVDNAVFPKYLNYSYKGSRYWQIKSFSSNKYIQMSANAGGTSQFHNFFMVPIDFTAANNFSFRVNVGFYNGDGLKVYTTNDYVPGSDISSATLTEITSNFTIPKGPAGTYGTLAPAGTYNIPASLTGKGFIVFKYEGVSPTVTTTYQLDDIEVK